MGASVAKPSPYGVAKYPRVLPEMNTPVPETGALEASLAAALTSAPLVITVLAACGVLLAIALDLRRLRLNSRLTVAHGVVGSAFAAAVLGLTMLMAVAVLPGRPALAADTPAPNSGEPTPSAGFPYSELQLPTLPGE